MNERPLPGRGRAAPNGWRWVVVPLREGECFRPMADVPTYYPPARLQPPVQGSMVQE